MRVYRGRHRFEHWYRDNQVYFITARCRGRFPAFASEEAKAIFWSRFEAAVEQHQFVSWVTSLLDNHYHTLGYLRRGEALPAMMNALHGGTAKLVNDVLQRQFQAGVLEHPRTITLDARGRLLPFWRDTKRKNYFDGCLRDEKQGRLTYRYVLTQSVRHGVTADHRAYRHTRVDVQMERAIRRAVELGAFLEGVRYKRYEG